MTILSNLEKLSTKKIMDSSTLAILDFMASLLLTLEKNIESLMVLEKNVNLYILLELLKKKEDWYVFMKRKSMDLMMVIQFLSEKLKE